MFVYKHTETICHKVAYFLRKIQTLRVNNLRIPGTENAKFLEYYFYLIKHEHIRRCSNCISVPLSY